METGFLDRIVRSKAPQAQVTVVHDGFRALDLLVQGAYCLAVLDRDLTGLSGMDIIRRARLRRVKTPVVLLCEHASRGLALRAQRLGAQELLEKPVLVSGVETVLRWFVDITSPSGEGCG